MEKGAFRYETVDRYIQDLCAILSGDLFLYSGTD